MVSSAEEQEIKRYMRRIKDAKDKGMGNDEIKRRTRELYVYLWTRGYVDG